MQNHKNNNKTREKKHFGEDEKKLIIEREEVLS